MKNFVLKFSVFIVLFSVLFFISSRDKENYTIGSWRSTLWVDPAGYNVYLPATFQYSFIHDFPEKMDVTVAYGFMLDKDKKVITKFTYGVALLQSPFYVAGLVVSKVLGIENTGYSRFNEVLIDLIGIFYACAALMLLFHILNQRFSKLLSFVTTLIIFAGTNTLYYATIHPGMSHIYSFFLVVLSIYCLLRYLKSPNSFLFCILAFSISLIILIRPLNILITLPLLFFDVNSFSDAKNRFKILFKPLNIFLFCVIIFLVFLPQFIYWKFAYGHYISDSYPGEGFSFLTHPKIKEFLFSPHNGLLLYSPLYFVLFCMLFTYYRKFKLMALAYLSAIVFVIYLSSSWFVFYFGCGFGGRNFVEYCGLLAFPLAVTLNENKNNFKKYILYIIISFCVFINLKLMYSWDLCFWGSNDWSWKEYNYSLWKPNKKLIQNFDSLNPKKVINYHNEKVYCVDSLEQYSPGFAFHQNSFSRTYFKTANISVDLFSLDTNSSAQLACMGFFKDSVIFYNASIIHGPKNQWKTFNLFSGLSFHETKDYQIKIFIMNEHKNRFYLKNFKVDLN